MRPQAARKHAKVISSWAVHYSRRRQVTAESKARRPGWLEPLKSTWSRKATAAIIIPALILLVVCLVYPARIMAQLGIPSATTEFRRRWTTGKPSNVPPAPPAHFSLTSSPQLLLSWLIRA